MQLAIRHLFERFMLLFNAIPNEFKWNMCGNENIAAKDVLNQTTVCQPLNGANVFQLI